MDGRGGRAVGMVGEVGAKLHVVGLERLVVEVGFGADVVNARMYAQIHTLRIARLGSGSLTGIARAHGMTILGICSRDVHEKVRLNHVVPAQGSNAVAPFPIEVQLLRAVALAVITVITVLVFHSGIHLVVA